MDDWCGGSRMWRTAVKVQVRGDGLLWYSEVPVCGGILKYWFLDLTVSYNMLSSR